MSFPTIPDVNPSINLTRNDSLNLLLASIAFEELGLAHLINAEAEKLQYVLGTIEGQIPLETPPTIDDLLTINQSIQQTLKYVIKKEMLLEFKLESILATPRACVFPFDFPSEDSTVIGSAGFIDEVAAGYFWSADRGDSVSETFRASECISRAILSVDVVNNVLAPEAFVTWELVINGVVVGSFTVDAGFTGEITEVFTFPAITGPNYDVELRVVNEVAPGEGSISLAYAGDFAHSLTLICCDAVANGAGAPAVETRKQRPSSAAPEYNLARNNR
jgi:hypothetical protein